MHRGLRAGTSQNQGPLPTCHDTKETQDSPTVVETPIEKMIKSGVIYEIQCPRCKSSYVGQTSRHLKTRFAEHRTREGPVKKHFRDCGVAIDDSHISIIGASARGEQHLLTLEALHIREKKPSINTKDEWRQRELTIKL